MPNFVGHRFCATLPNELRVSGGYLTRKLEGKLLIARLNRELSG